MLDRIESAINYVSDLNWAWWPFLSLRPGMTERISARLVLLFAVFVTVVAHGIVVLVRVANDQAIFLESDVIIPFTLFVFVSMWFAVVAFFWNRRAHRLTRRAQ